MWVVEVVDETDGETLSGFVECGDRDPAFAAADVLSRYEPLEDGSICIQVRCVDE